MSIGLSYIHGGVITPRVSDHLVIATIFSVFF
jgi:hypothetical protein